MSTANQPHDRPPQSTTGPSCNVCGRPAVQFWYSGNVIVHRRCESHPFHPHPEVTETQTLRRVADAAYAAHKKARLLGASKNDEVRIPNYVWEEVMLALGQAGYDMHGWTEET